MEDRDYDGEDQERWGQDFHPGQHTDTQCHPQEAVLNTDTIVWHTEHHVAQRQAQQAAPPPSAWHWPQNCHPPASTSWFSCLEERMDRPEADGGRTH